MKILVVGGGGREHALVWKIAQSPLVSKIYCAPGNAGIAELAECFPISVSDIPALAKFAEENAIDLTVVGPEAPLTLGIVDYFEGRGMRIVGPSASCARIEGSKIFAKRLMQNYGIPTAEFWEAQSLQEGIAHLNAYYSTRSHATPIVIKADGLAAGKGVTVAQNRDEALLALQTMMGDMAFGEAGSRVVIEECLFGEEASIIAITDGYDLVPLVPTQDHKRIGEGDTGPNTGGMGAYSPVPAVSQEIVEEAVERILRPAIQAIADLGIPYRGFLYAGIMITEDGIKTIEFNCRLGDPETQVIIPLLKSDLVPLLLGSTDCTLGQAPVEWHDYAATTVVASSGGYPGKFQMGKEIKGLEKLRDSKECVVFHSGTTLQDGKPVTSGGRVLCVTGIGSTIMDSVANAYIGLSNLDFEGMYYRKDIATRALRHLSDE